MSEDTQEETAGVLATILRGMTVDWVLVSTIDIKFILLASLWQEFKMIVGVRQQFIKCAAVRLTVSIHYTRTFLNPTLQEEYDFGWKI